MNILSFFPTSQSDIMENGWAFNLSYQFFPNFLDYLYLGFESGYISSPSKTHDGSYQWIPLGLFASYHIPFSKDFFVYGKLGAGGYLMSTPNKHTIFNFYGKASLGTSYFLSKDWFLSIEGAYIYFHDPLESIRSLQAGVSVSYVLSSSEKEAELSFKKVSINKMFASEYTRYFQEPVGEIELTNTGKEAIEDIQVSLFVKNLMLKKSLSRMRVPSLMPGASRKVPIYAFYDKNIKYLEADTKTVAFLELTYKSRSGKAFKKEKTIDVIVHHKNALIWDDLNKLGAFIQSEDKAVVDFSRKAIQLAQGGSGLDENIQNALKLFLALQSYGLSYIADPKAGYQMIPSRGYVTDYIQYPRETLQKKAGDCDDFTVLFVALLESIGIKTAVVATNNHVFLMFQVGSGVNLKTITWQGRKWIPLDITLLKQGFVKSWEKAFDLYNGTANKRVKSTLEMISEYHPISFEDPVSIYAKINSLEFEQKYKAQKEKILKKSKP